MTSVEKSGNGVQQTMPGLHVVTLQEKGNSMADAASQKFNDRQEWKLNEAIFKELCCVFGVPNTDLLASRLNKQVPPFCSWQPDPEAEHFDAFSINCSHFELVNIFPPFALIARGLKKCVWRRRGGG